MEDRDTLTRELDRIDQGLRELITRYEKYFAGVDKMEPAKEREEIARRLRNMMGKFIRATDIKFRVQSLASRLATYSGNWDRTLRLMDEGKWHRPKSRPGSAAAPPPADKSPQAGGSELDRVHSELESAYRGSGGKTPDRRQVEALLEKQREKIREKFGDRPVEFHVVTEDGKPKIKVRAKK